MNEKDNGEISLSHTFLVNAIEREKESPIHEKQVWIMNIHTLVVKGVEVIIDDLLEADNNIKQTLLAALKYSPRLNEFLNAKVEIGGEKQSWLYRAYDTQDDEVYNALLDLGADPRFDNEAEMTAAHVAAAKGDMPGLKKLIEKDSTLLFATRNGGNTPLLEAINENQTEAAKYLIERIEADTTKSDGEKNEIFHTALNDAVEKENIEITSELINKRKCILNMTDDTGNTPLANSILDKRWKSATFIVEQQDVDIEKTDTFARKPPLETAIEEAEKQTHESERKPYLELITKLVSMGAKIPPNVYLFGTAPVTAAISEGKRGIKRTLETSSSTIETSNTSQDAAPEPPKKKMKPSSPLVTDFFGNKANSGPDSSSSGNIQRSPSPF